MRLRALLARLRPHGRALAVAAALLGAGGLLPGLAIWLLKAALDHVGDPRFLAGTCVALVALSAGQSAANLARATLTRRVAAEIASDLRRRVHAAYLARDGDVGNRLSALTDEVDQVQYGVSALVTAIRNPISLVALIGTAWVLAPSLAGLGLALFAVVAAGGALASRAVRRAATAARLARAELSALGAEQLANGEVVRAFGAEPGERERFAALDLADRTARTRLEIVRVVPSSVVEVAGAAAVALVMGLGSWEVAGDQLSGSALVAAVAALLLANRPLAGLAEVGSLLSRSLAALDRVEAALTDPAPRVGGSTPVPAGPLAVRWEAATVRIGARAIVCAATGAAEPGELVALVGPTGAGKTTLLRLAAGVVGADEGAVTIGGVPVAELDPVALRGALAVVPQDPLLFGRSVAENVALGAEPPDEERVRAALTAAGAEFALGWPLETATVLAERAAGLSGGERQRLCLARALYREARVLLLDEPTAQLDAVTAAAFAETLRGLRAGRAVVVATHDPEVWGRADRVLRVEHGVLG